MRSILLRFGLLAAALVISLGVAELSVRLLGLGPVILEPLNIPSYQLSRYPAIGYEYQPNYRAADESFDSFHDDLETNSHGFRDSEFRETKPSGVTRILVLGDSITAGNGLRSMDGTYPKVLERLLNEGSSGKRYEVFNMGVGGYHTSQEVETLRYKGLAFDPDYVLIGFCLNDLSTNASGGVYERLVAANEDTGWVEGVQARDRWFLKNSRAALLVAHYVGALSAESARSGDGRVEGPSNVSYGLRLLDELQSEHGFRALVVIVPAFDAPFDAYRYPRLHARMMQALPPGERIPVLDLLPRFQSAGHDAATLSRDGVHPNEAGHEAVARILLSELPEIFPEL